MMKPERQELIVDLISSGSLETQEELAAALQKHGVRVTQATVSRDIREMHLIKVSTGDGHYRYSLPVRQDNGLHEKLDRILKDALISVDHAGHMIVVRTISGSANIAAEALDSLQWPEILGTIAGDNTIFIVVRSESKAGTVAARIKKMALGV